MKPEPQYLSVATGVERARLAAIDAQLAEHRARIAALCAIRNRFTRKLALRRRHRLSGWAKLKAWKANARNQRQGVALCG